MLLLIQLLPYHLERLRVVTDLSIKQVMTSYEFGGRKSETYYETFWYVLHPLSIFST